MHSLLISALFLTSAAFAAYQPQIRVTPIAEGIYVFESGRDGYNSHQNVIAVVNQQDVLMFDSNARPTTARAILAELRKITPKPVRWVVNSHHHPDHWSGNEVYAKEFPGVQIIATEECRDFMRYVSPAWPAVFAGSVRRSKASLEEAIRTGKSKDGSPYTAANRQEDEQAIERTSSFVDESTSLKRVFPNFVYKNSMDLTIGGREFRFLELYGDATGSTVLYLPKEKILLVGDMIAHPYQWGSNSDSLAPWIKSLHQLAATDVSTIVPGHGPVFHDKAYLNLVIELFETVRAEVRLLLESGAIELAEVKKAIRLNPKIIELHNKFAAAGSDFEDECVRMAYREARDGREFTR